MTGVRVISARLLRLFCLLVVLAGLAAVTTRAQEPAPSPKVQEFLQLLSERDVQDWLTARQYPPKGSQVEAEAELAIDQKLKAVRNHLRSLLKALPRIPSTYMDAANHLRQDAAGYRPIFIFLIAGLFIAIGLALQWIFARILRGGRTPTLGQDTSLPSVRLAILSRRFFGDVCGAGLFAAGSLGAFLFFDWPDMLRSAVVMLLAAAVAWMVAHAVLTALFGDCVLQERQIAGSRLMPMSSQKACYMKSRLGLAAAWFAFGYAFIRILSLLSTDKEVVQLTAYAFGLGLLVIGIGTVWRIPAEAAGPPSSSEKGIARGPIAWIYIFGFAILWILWVAGAMLLFWFIAAALVAPLAISWSQRVVQQLLATPNNTGAGASAHGLVAVLAERLLRAAIILAVIWWLTWAWGISLDSLAGGDDLLTRTLRSVLKVVVILLVGDLVWQLVRTMIDVYLLRSAVLGEPGSKEAIRRAKARTLLPIVRNVAMVFLAALAVMMSLSTLGVDIAPLIASAGVVGVAVGFGAQTVVKDIISGMFYLLDDAFRVGEYIVSGSFKGTVESFSLRSVKLRHHNGPVYTIPFGDLGAVQNMSRDYAIDKFTLTVTYDSDIDKARKLIKQIGEQLKLDPELSNVIIEPMRMQRVDQFGDYGIVLKVKMKTRPGEQFAVRKKAFPMIKRLFDEHGIEFAYPTVKVAGDDHDKKTAAARQALAIKASQPPSS